MLAFPKNDGLRLDYIFATGPLAARCTTAEIDRQERKGAEAVRSCAGGRGLWRRLISLNVKTMKLAWATDIHLDHASEAMR